MERLKEVLKAPWYTLGKGKPYTEDSNVYHHRGFTYTKDHKFLLNVNDNLWINTGGITQDLEVVNLVRCMVTNLPELYELLHQSYLHLRPPSFTDEDIPELTEEDIIKRYEDIRSKLLEAARPVKEIETAYSDDSCYHTGERNLTVRLDCTIKGGAHPYITHNILRPKHINSLVLWDRG